MPILASSYCLDFDHLVDLDRIKHPMRTNKIVKKDMGSIFYVFWNVYNDDRILFLKSMI